MAPRVGLWRVLQVSTKTVMTKEEFKARWESNDSGGGITFDDIADCAVAWQICTTPRIMPLDKIRYTVLKAADTDDAEDFNPKGGFE